jgi:hypothetical protein
MAGIRRMGDGWEALVDEVDGKLIYALPVTSSVVTMDFEFEIFERDLEVLLADPYRRALLEAAAHRVLQRSMIRGNPKVTPEQFAGLVAQVLHAAPEQLEQFIDEIDREYKSNTRWFAEQDLARRAAAKD